MLETLSSFLDHAGAFAPLLYVSFYLATALLPFIPTPLVSALGGSLLGFGPAVAYGVIGLGLGAGLALGLSRSLGRPVLIRIFGARVWEEWEALLGVRSPLTWGVIFFLLNIDFAVVAAGLSPVPLRKLWLAAVVARLPWLVASALVWGKLSRVEPPPSPWRWGLLGIFFVAVNLVRPRLRRYLVAKRAAAEPHQLEVPPASSKSRLKMRGSSRSDKRVRLSRSFLARPYHQFG